MKTKIIIEVKDLKDKIEKLKNQIADNEFEKRKAIDKRKYVWYIDENIYLTGKLHMLESMFGIENIAYKTRRKKLAERYEEMD